MNGHDLQTTDRHCIFKAAGSTFAISVLSVCEIAERPPLVAVPDAPSALAGLCHFRTEFVPVINLPHFVGIPASECRDTAFLLVLTGFEGSWAVPVDRGLALEPLEISYSETNDESQIIIGTASYRNEIVQVLDADVLYQHAAQLLQNRWQGNGRDRSHATTAC